MKPVPIVSAFLVCDSVIKDADTGKVSLIGLFNAINVSQFPAVHPSLALFASLTDAEGEYDVRVDLVHVASNTLTARFPPPDKPPMRIASDERLNYTDLIVRLQGLRFDEPGEYEFRLFVDGKLIALRRFWVRQQ